MPSLPPQAVKPATIKTERVLLPIDVRNCALDVFPLVNAVGSRAGVRLTLLHVVTLSILPPESRIYDELRTEANLYLEHLAKEYLPSVPSPTTCVRAGSLVEEILAEAANADLIILPSGGPSFWQRLGFLWKHPLHPMVSGKTRQIMDHARCGVFIAPSQTRFDCERHWGRRVGHAPEVVNSVARSPRAIRPKQNICNGI
jgi:nucleotide-binding universal stress UspA family protein